MTNEQKMTTAFPRLNPFAFPSDTDFRFALLMVVVIGASLFIYTLLYNALPSNWDHLQLVLTQCTSAAKNAYPTNATADVLARNQAIFRCSAPFYQEQALTVVGGVILLLAIAGCIYLIFPVWKIRHDKLELVSAEDSPEMVAYLADLCRMAELQSQPQFLVKALGRAPSGLAFGRRGRYYVVLHGGLIKMFARDRAIFRAVVLHELAHLRNADVDKTYFSLALGFAFLLAVLLPWLVTLPFTQAHVGNVLNIIWRVLTLSLFIYLTLLAILRAREVYADVRASVWDGPGGGLARTLQKLPRPKEGHWRQIVRAHPDPVERYNVLHETDRLFPIGFWEAFTVGLAASVISDTFDSLINALLPTSNSFLSSLATALFLGVLVIGVLGVGIWRATFATMVRGKKLHGLGQLGIGAGLGFLLGQRLSLNDYAVAQGGLALTGPDLVIFFAIWIPLVGLSFYAFLCWIAAGASTWLEVALVSRSPRRAYRFGLIFVGFWLVIWLALLIYNESLYTVGNLFPFARTLDALAQVAGTPSSSPLFVLMVILVAVVNPLTFLALISLWALPLSAYFWRRRMASSPLSQWPFLDRVNTPLKRSSQPSLRVMLALIIGLVGGGIAAVLLVALDIGAGAELSRSDTFLFVQAGGAILTQMVVAGIAAAWIKRLGSLHGLFSAFVAGCIVAGLFLFVALLHPMVPVPGFSLSPIIVSWGILSIVLNGGALMSLPVVLAISLLKRLWNAHRPHTQGDG